VLVDAPAPVLEEVSGTKLVPDGPVRVVDKEDDGEVVGTTMVVASAVREVDVGRVPEPDSVGVAVKPFAPVLHSYIAGINPVH